jgi:hypothetical protein
LGAIVQKKGHPRVGPFILREVEEENEDEDEEDTKSMIAKWYENPQ